MGIKDVLQKAFVMSNEWKFFVQIDLEEIKEMSYLELGVFLTSSVEQIELIHVKTKD